jgi:glycerol-3-phosphate acyltransferase PlsY
MAVSAATVSIAAVVGGYLLGSIPFGVIATRLGGAGDLRQIGSGSIGATNVLRTGRRDLAAITLIGDGGKGAAAALIALVAAIHFGAPSPPAVAAAVAGGAAFVGHIFPVWLGFRGGKGVATFFGVLLAVAWPVGLAAGATWIALAALFRFSSLAGLTAALLAPVYAWLFHAPLAVIIMAAGMAVLIFMRHHENIRRLLRGEEPKISFGRKPPEPAQPMGHNGGPPMEGA